MRTLACTWSASLGGASGKAEELGFGFNGVDVAFPASEFHNKIHPTTSGHFEMASSHPSTYHNIYGSLLILLSSNLQFLVETLVEISDYTRDSELASSRLLSFFACRIKLLQHVYHIFASHFSAVSFLFASSCDSDQAFRGSPRPCPTETLLLLHS